MAGVEPLVGDDLWLRVDTETHNSPIRQIVTLPWRSLFVTVGSDQRMKVWDAELHHHRTLVGEFGVGNCGDLLMAAASADWERPVLAVLVDWPAADSDRILRLYDVAGDARDWSSLGSIRWPDLNGFAFTPDGQHLITTAGTALEAHRVEALVDAVDGRAGSPVAERSELEAPATAIEQTYSAGPGTGAHIAAFTTSSGALRVALSEWPPDHHTAHWLPSIYELDPASGTAFARPGVSEDELGYRPDRFAASHDHLAVTPHDGGPVRVYDHDGNVLFNAPVANNEAAQLAYSADGSLLIAASGARTECAVTVHDATRGYGQVGQRRYAIQASAAGFLDLVDEAGNAIAVSAGGARYWVERWPARTEWSDQDRQRSSASATTHAIGVTTSGEDSGAIAVSVGQADGQVPAAAGQSLDARGSLAATPIRPPSWYVASTFDLLARRFAAGSGLGSDSPLDGALLHEQQGQDLSIAWDTQHLQRNGQIVDPFAGRSDMRWDFPESYGFLPDGTITFGGRTGNIQLVPEDATASPLELVGHSDMVLALGASPDSKWLVSGGLDQVIRLWYLPDVRDGDKGAPGRPALNLFMTVEGEWVIWSESGYYDSSPNGDGYIGFHRNNGEGVDADTFASDRLARTLYRPDVIDRILETGSEQRALAALGSQAPELSALLATPPTVALFGDVEQHVLGYSTSLEFTVSLPHTRVWVLEDGVLVWEQDVDPDRDDGHYLVEDLMLAPGPNPFRILARNGDVKSAPVDVIVTAHETMSVPEPQTMTSGPDPEPLVIPAPGPAGPGGGDSDDRFLTPPPVAAVAPAPSAGTGSIAAADRPPEEVPRKLFMVAIGVSDHESPDENVKDLKYAHRDAERLAESFRTQEGGLYGEVWQRLLVNETATRDGIRQALDELRTAAAERAAWKRKNRKRARDLTVLFFSGHGSAFDPESSEKELFLICHDVDPANLSATAMPVKELGEILTSLPTDIVVMIDACRSGRAGRDLYGEQLAKRLHEIREVNQTVFASARYRQVSFEYDSLQHGVFTHALLKELQRPGPGIAIGELTTGVQRSVLEFTDERQEPTYRPYGDFPLVPLYSPNPSQPPNLEGKPVNNEASDTTEITLVDGSTVTLTMTVRLTVTAPTGTAASAPSTGTISLDTATEPVGTGGSGVGDKPVDMT